MISEDREDNLSLYCLKTGSLVTLIATIYLIAAHQTGWAWGFCIGALLSLFSLFSLAVVVPFLFRPNAPRHMTILLGMTLFMKLPLYCVGLYLLTHLPGIQPAASVFGIALVPALVTLKTLASSRTAKVRAAAPQPAEEATPRTRRAVRAEVVHERG